MTFLFCWPCVNFLRTQNHVPFVKKKPKTRLRNLICDNDWNVCSRPLSNHSLGEDASSPKSLSVVSNPRMARSSHMEHGKHWIARDVTYGYLRVKSEVLTVEFSWAYV